MTPEPSGTQRWLAQRRMSQRDRVAMRRDVILADLQRHPLSSTAELSERILRETGGAPTIATGAIWIPTWTLLADLNALHKQGKVYKFKTPAHRAVCWQVAENAR